MKPASEPTATAREDLRYLEAVDQQLASRWPLPKKPRLFEPLRFLEGDRGDFLSLYEILARAAKVWIPVLGEAFTDIDVRNLRRTASHLDKHKAEALKALDDNDFWLLVRCELARRAIRDAIPEGEVDRETTRKARRWILKYEIPIAGLPHELEFALPLPYRYVRGRGAIHDVSLEAVRERLRHYLLTVEGGDLTTKEDVGHPKIVSSRQRQQQQDVPLLDEASLPEAPADGRRSKTLRNIDFPRLKDHLTDLENDLGQLHDPVVTRFQVFLDALADKACPTFGENAALARSVIELADRHGIQLFYEKAATDSRSGKTSELQQVRVQCVNRPDTVAGVFRVWTFHKDEKKRLPLGSSPAFPRLIAGRAE